MRSVLGKYNQLLSNTHIDIFDLELPVLEIGSGKRKMRLQINQRDKFVRRIFNNSRWDQGGRFYGGWWQRCPKDYRKKIKMDGMMTAEIDFSGLHIVMLYGQQGINYWAEINEDPYQLHGINDIDPTFSHDDMFCFKLAVHFAQQNLPQSQFHQPRPKAPDSSGVRDICTQFKVTEFPEQRITKQ